MRSRRTLYRGVWFRSELEARWAVWLDHMHLPWRYEMAGFEFEDDSSYLPDFWLPSLSSWAETKPVSVSPTSAGKAIKLAVETSTNVYMLLGWPEFAFDRPDGQIIRFTPLAQSLTGYRWASCEKSSRVGITIDGNTKDLLCCEHADTELGHTTARIFTATMLSRLWTFKE